MHTIDRDVFHKLYGPKKPRAVYYKKDFCDYLLMIMLCGSVIIVSYGLVSPMSILGLGLCTFTVSMFMARHGVEFTMPVVLARPQELLYLFFYKLQNLKPVYFVALAMLVLENVLIAATPNFPHHANEVRKAALYLFYGHFLSITAYRTAILIEHLRKKHLVREVLMQTAWQRVIKEDTNITLEIFHAYVTGILSHIILIAPWYVVITHVRFSLIFLPVTFAINIAVHVKWIKVLNEWFYRDHWLGHNSELDFIYLHGAHHDAIPSGLIAVAENGFLEGFLRHTIGYPSAFYNPLATFLLHTSEIKKDIDVHQYIPGIFPRMKRELMEIAQHSTHHYGSLEPYGFGLNFDHPSVTAEIRKAYQNTPDSLKYSIRLDQALTGFKWDNPTFRRILDLYDKYHSL